MSSSTDELAANLQELYAYRKEVDLQIEQTLTILNTAGFSAPLPALSANLKVTLLQGRQAVDDYAALPWSERTSKQLDDAIKKMFEAWDSCHEILKNVLVHSVGKGTSASESYTLILILVDLRDQAGRVASNIMASVTSAEKNT